MRENPETFVPQVDYRALDLHVLAVSRTRIEGAWAAYIGAVPGENHWREHTLVLERGTKLSEGVARALFPQYKDVPYAP